MKRFLSAILTLCMMTSMVPSTAMLAFAAESTETEATIATDETQNETVVSTWEYETYGEGITLTAYNGTATDVYVPSTVDGQTVIRLGDGLFYDNDGLNSVTLGTGITEIGNQAFYDCDNMVCIVTNEELTTIGAEAFYSCDVFNSIILYDAVISIGENAFVGCPGLTIWCNIGTAGHTYAITNDVSWEELNPEAIPETVVLNGATYYISNGSALLMSVEKADRIVIPAYVNDSPVTSINADALYYLYSNVVEVFIPDTIVNIPDDLSYGDKIIMHCGEGSAMHNYLEKNELPYILTQNNAEPETVSIDDYTFYVYNNGRAALKSYTGTASQLVVPEQISGATVEKIMPKAFDGVSVQEIMLPDSIDYMYPSSFYACKKLVTVNIPTATSHIAPGAFSACYFLENVKMHDGIKSIGTDAFGNENHITELEIPDSIEYIAQSAFRGTRLTQITYPLNAVVCDDAFTQGRVEKVIIPAEVTDFNMNAFESSVIYAVYSGSSAQQYCQENGLMYYCVDTENEPYTCSDPDTGALTFRVFDTYAVLTSAYLYETSEIEIPAYIDGVPVTIIYDHAFENQTSVKTILLPETITHIGEGAFSYCEALESINLPDGITKISAHTFENCTSLKALALPQYLEVIGNAAFYRCAIEYISFPETLRSIGDSAFNYSDLKELDYPNIECGKMAFENCSSLTKVTIASGVSSLPYRVFMDCENLEIVDTPNSLNDIDQYAFAFCPKVTFLHPSGAPSTEPIGIYAEKYGKNVCYSGWSGFLNPVEFEQDGIIYYATSNYSHRGYTATVVGCTSDTAGHVTIPKTVKYEGKTYSVDKIGDRAFDYSDITSIDIPESIKVIGDAAFQGSDLEKIELPQNLEYFGINMFNAARVKEFTFPINYSLNFGLFGYTDSVERIIIPEGVKLIPEYAFMQCDGFDELILPESLEYIAVNSMWGVGSVRYLTIPAKTVVADGAIAAMGSLEVLKFSEGTTSISDNFDNCRNLSRVYLPESITYINYDAFEQCPNAIFCVYEDTYAHEYCEKRGLPYFILTETENPEIAYGTGISGVVSYTDGNVAGDIAVDILHDDGTVKETVTTDSIGTYSFTYAEVGRYTIRVTDASGNTASSQVSVKRMNVFDVFLAGDTNLTLKKGWTVSGTVAGGAATVTITDANGNVLDTVETADGSFAFDNIPNGSYIVKAETENGTVTQEITVFDGAVSDITLTVVSENVTVWGYVEVEDREYNHHRRNWVQVSIYNAEGVVVAQTKSDKDGMYRFEKLPVGHYSIVAETAEMRPDKKHHYDRRHSLTGYAYVDASAAGEYQADTIVLYEENDSLATISGKVTAQGESQACQVVLRNVFRHEVAQQTTGKNGKYCFTNVRDGLYFITAITESNGMGYTVVAVRNGKVHGETDITIRKADKIKDREDRFHKDFDSCHDRDTALKHKDRIVEEKRFYDGLSDKEKKQLSREYVDHLNRMCEWIAECEYVTDEGVTVEQGGLVISGDELENEETVTFEINVEKTDAWTANTEGVKEDKDFIYHDMHDKAGKGQIKQYYEISMTKTVDGQTKQITSVTKDTDSTGKFRITMEIPEEYRGHKHYTMLHVHNGETVTLADLDDDPNTITFEVDGFSTFALTGTDEILVPVANAEIWQDTQLYGNYTTLEEAVTAYDSTTQYVKLIQDTEVTLNLSQDLYVDLNGYTLTGTIISNGYMIYGMDSTTNSYTCDTMGYFNCTDADGSAIVPEKLVKTTTEMTGNVLRYMTVETESGYTFHRFYLGITHTSLKPSVTGVGYQALFCGDDMVKAQLDADNAFGYTMQLDGFRSVSVYKGADHFVSGKTVTLRINNYDAQNFGETPLHAFVNMKLADGTLIESALYTVTLRQLVESVNESYTSYTETQLAAVISMIEKNSIMQSWNVSNLYSEESAE